MSDKIRISKTNQINQEKIKRKWDFGKGKTNQKPKNSEGQNILSRANEKIHNL